MGKESTHGLMVNSTKASLTLENAMALVCSFLRMEPSMKATGLKESNMGNIKCGNKMTQMSLKLSLITEKFWIKMNEYIFSIKISFIK